MSEPLKDRIQLEQDMEHCYPIIDCPECGAVDVPVGYLNSIRAEPYTLCCHTILENIKPKGYVSLLDLEESYWNEQL